MGSKLKSKSKLVVFAMFAAVATIYAGGKIVKRFTFDAYLVDAGSYATNSTVHVAATATSSILHDANPYVMLYAREASSTNAADWAMLPPAIPLNNLPCDWMLDNATNYVYYVAVNYVPPVPDVEEDFHIHGFEMPDGVAPYLSNDPTRYAFPSSKVK